MSCRAEVGAPTRGSRYLRHLLTVLDTVSLTGAWLLATVLAPGGEGRVTTLLSIVVLVTAGLLLFGRLGLYRARVCNLRTVEYARIARGCLLLAVFALAFGSATRSSLTRGEIALGASLTFMATVLARSGYRAWLTSSRRAGNHLRSVLLVGAGEESAEIALLLQQHPELGYEPVGVVGQRLHRLDGEMDTLWRGELHDAAGVLEETGATGAIICVNDLRSIDLNRVVQELLQSHAHVQMSSGLKGVDVGRLRPAPIAYEPFFYVEPVTLASWELATKRAIDYALASLVLVLMAPVLGAAALAIKLSDRGPVFFKQHRVGRDGKTFLLYKLRTMRVGAEHEVDNLASMNLREGPLFKVNCDPRVTKLGRLLRATSIDELPQLWNVLNGTMSLVGPRPALPGEVEHFDAELRTRDTVRPGITGLWQVEGRENPSFDAYRRFDLFYLYNWHIALDLMILVGTMESVVSRTIHALRNTNSEIGLQPPPESLAQRPSTADAVTGRAIPSARRKEQASAS